MYQIGRRLCNVVKILFLCIPLCTAQISYGWAQESVNLRVLDLIEKLKQGDKGKPGDLAPRVEAGTALQKLVSPEAKGAVPALIEIFKDNNEDPRIRVLVGDLLRRIEPEPNVVPILVKILKDKNNHEIVRGVAIVVFEAMEQQAKSAIPALINVLRDKNEKQSVRIRASFALETIGPDSEAAMGALADLIKDKREDSYSRVSAIRALQRRPPPKGIIPTLIELMRDTDEDSLVRESAALGLRNAGPDAKAAIPTLIEVVKDKGKTKQFRRHAGEALAKMGPDAKAAIPDLIEVVKDKHDHIEARLGAAFALGGLGLEAKAAIPALLEVVKDRSEDRGLRRHAGEALAKMGPDAKAAIPDLIEVVKNKKEDGDTRQAIALALGGIAEQLQDVGSIPELEKAVAALNEAGLHEDARRVNRATQVIRAINRANTFNLAIIWVRQHEWISSVFAYFALASLVSVTLIWLRPLWVLRINDALKPYTDFRLPDALGGMKVPVRYVLLIGFFHYNRRVLDAWVAKYIDAATEAFQNGPTIRDRSVHIPVPVILDQQAISSLTVEHLRPKFVKRRGRWVLLICGEGGSGKTSLACQVAKWAMAEDETTRLCEENRMIPVLIEYDLDAADGKGQEAFKEAVRGQLCALIGASDPPSEELACRLLARRRILVIVDRFSELSDTTRKLIRLGDPGFPINALVITSRIEEQLNGVPRTTIKPLRIQGNRLSTFMEAYLVQCGKRDLFDDTEYFDACRQLSLIVGQRDITVLLARMYADLMITSKEKGVEGQLPNNIPDLMLNYLNWLNRGAKDNEPGDRTVHHAAKAIAWECSKRTYRPITAGRADILAALERQEDAEGLLRYLEDRLRLIQTIGPGRDQIGFTLDPLAEYLAGLYLLDHYRDKEEPWRDFLAQAGRMAGAPESIKGLLLAVRDCCLANGAEAGVPQFVSIELAEQASLKSSGTPQSEEGGD